MSGSIESSLIIPSGEGNVIGPGPGTVANQIVLFQGTNGQNIKAATGTGVVHATSGVYSVSNVVLTSEVTGVLPVANGGTNAIAFDTGAVTYFNGTKLFGNAADIYFDPVGVGNGAFFATGATNLYLNTVGLGAADSVITDGTNGTGSLTAQANFSAGTTVGGKIQFYGGAHATKAAKTEFYQNATLSGSISSAGVWNIPNLTASQLVATDASKNLVSVVYTNANTASAVVQRDGSGNFSAGTITASLSGNATSATTATTATTATNATNVATTSTSTNASFFPLFVASSSNSNQAADLNASFTFNPSTVTLTATTFAGALSGNATTATTATNATNVATTSTSTNASFFPLFVASSSNSNQAADLNSSFTFNPSTGVIAAPKVSLSSTLIIGGNTTGDSNLGTISSVSNSAYYEGSFVLDFGGTGSIFNSPFNVTVKYVKTGSHVTLSIPEITGTVANSTATLNTNSGAIPSLLRPGTEALLLMGSTRNTGANDATPGLIDITTGGQIIINRASVAVWTSTLNGGCHGFCVSYTTN